MTATERTGGEHGPTPPLSGQEHGQAPRERAGERDPATGDRRAARAVTRAFRPRRTVPAVVVATLLAVLAAVVAAEIVSHLLDRPLGLLPTAELARLGRETRWNDPLALTLSAVASAIGLLLLLLAFLPGRARAVAVTPGRPDLLMGVTPGAVARIAEDAAARVDGVSRARARMRGDRIRVRAESPLRENGHLSEQVRQAVSDRVGQLGLVRRPRVRVTVRHEREP
ncbi:MAG: DUF6286 domain-containing protein [Micromonosporaceae bacterium]|jgi:hypothetical protein